MATPFKTYRTASGKTILETLAAYGAKAEASLGRQLYQEGEGIMAQSKPLVPVDTSALRSSGYVAQPVRVGDVIRVELGYGGPAAKINPKTGESVDAYALIVHENLEAHHKVGIAKYLELPFLQAQRGMSARVAAGVRADMRGAGGPAAAAEEEA